MHKTTVRYPVNVCQKYIREICGRLVSFSMPPFNLVLLCSCYILGTQVTDVASESSRGTALEQLRKPMETYPSLGDTVLVGNCRLFTFRAWPIICLGRTAGWQTAECSWSDHQSGEGAVKIQVPQITSNKVENATGAIPEQVKSPRKTCPPNETQFQGASLSIFLSFIYKVLITHAFREQQG